MCVGRQSQGQLPCGDVRAVSYLSVVQDLRDVAGDWSFKHLYICFRRRLSPVAKASAKELSASYSARLDSCPDGELGTGLNTSTTAPLKNTGRIPRERLHPYKARNSLLTLRVHPQVLLDVLLDGD